LDFELDGHRRIKEASAKTGSQVGLIGNCANDIEVGLFWEEITMKSRALTVRAVKCGLLALSIIFGFANEGIAQDTRPSQILITNVNIFDGKAENLAMGMSVLVEGNLIKQVTKGVIEAVGATVIDGGGRTLMPGLIDNHVHLVLTGANLSAIEGMDWGQIAYASVPMAEMYLMEGFTTVRDVGGAPAALREAIDRGDLVGPRLYTALAFLGGRGGHADFGTFSSKPDGETNMNRLNMAQQVDGVDQTILYARNNFRQGATLLKVMQSGGVVSLFDPWQMEGRTIEEIETAVEIADQYNSYVAAHSYRKDSILRALNAGVKSIEHGFMFDGEIAALMKEKGAYITTNLTAFDPSLLDIPAVKSDPRTLRKAVTASAAFVDYIDNVRKFKPKRGYHTDCVGAYKACRKQIAYEKFLNGDFFGNHRALVALTSAGGEIAALSGNIVNPYQDGKLGVIEQGAYADILIVDGNPLEDLSVIGTQDKWFDGPDRPEGVETIRIIMKDGKVYKNTLSAASPTSPDEDEATIRARLTIDGRIAIYGVQFKTGSAELIEGSERSIEVIASVLKANSDVKIAVVGHTDASGNHEHNLELSKLRADTVVAALVGRHGIAEDRLFAAGASFLSPIASNDNEEGRALNRRVELVRVQ